MKEQAWNIRSQVVPNTGSGKVTPILEIDYRNVGGGGDYIQMSEEEHEFIMNNYIDLIFKHPSRHVSNSFIFYKPCTTSIEDNDYIEFEFAKNIYHISGSTNTSYYLSYDIDNQRLYLTQPPT